MVDKLETQPKYFTPEQANRMLPLVRSILKDVVEGAGRYGRELESLRDAPDDSGAQHRVHAARDALQEHIDELERLGIHLKDANMGLVDFPTMRDGREVYLCWHPGEDRVGHWHDIDAGFASRQPL